MASNFHNILGFLAAGVDVHMGLVPPLFAELPCAEAVAVQYLVLGPDQKSNVKINGVNSVVDGHTSMVSWPHLPIAPYNMLWPLDFAFGTHSCWLPRGTVHIDGTPSTCAMAGSVSMDLDCWEWAPIPSDLTLQFGTVQTTPSLSDFLYGAVRALVSGALQFGMSKGFSALGKIKIKGSPLSRFTEKWNEKIGNRLVKSGKGFKFARAIGKPIMSDFVRGASRQKVSGASWAAGRRFINSAIGRMLPKDAGSLAKTGLDAFGWDPGKVVAQHTVGPLAGQKASWNPFGGFKGTGLLDSKVPLYGAAHGGVQAVGG